MERAMNTKNAVKILLEIKEIFDRNEIRFWLEGGVLLGAMRDGKIIPWDHDIDLCIWKKDVSKLRPGSGAFSEMDKKGYELYFLEDKVSIEKSGIPTKLSLFVPRRGEAVRTYLMAKNKTGELFRILWWLLAVDYCQRFRFKKILKPKVFAKMIAVKTINIIFGGYKKKLAKKIAKLLENLGCEVAEWVVPIHFFKKLGHFRFYGKEFLAPVEIGEYMVFRYGKDWKTPIKKWSTFNQDGAISRIKKPKAF